MDKIYLAAYKEFTDYKKLCKVLDFMLSKKSKDEVLFYVSSGEDGDSTCMRYVKAHGYKYVDWCKDKHGNRAKQKLPFIQDSTHSILITDGESRGISIALRYSIKYVKGKLVLVMPLDNIFSVWENREMIAEKEIK